MAVKIDWKQLLKSPQALVSGLSAAVAVLGTVGIVNTNLAGALQTLLMAALGVVTAMGHTAAAAKVTAKQQAKQQLVTPAPGATAGG